MITPGIEKYLNKTVIPLRLACVTPTGWPVVLSLWYLYRDGKLYCATKKTAKVVGYLQETPRCGFEIAADAPPYCGIRGQANVTLDEGLGPGILKNLAVRYLGSLDKPLAKKLLARSDEEVALVLEPVNLFQWNYADRMKDSVAGAPEKPCPE